MQRIQQLIREVHRRSLWQVLSIYVVAAWIVFEVIQTLTEGLGLPDWFPALAIVLLLIGLPIVLATAFIQEGMHPSRHDPTLIPTSRFGSERSSSVTTGEPPAARRFFTWRNALVGGALAFGLWGVIATVWLLTQGADVQGSADADPPVAAAPVAATESGRPAPGYRASIAVLPFDNLSGTEDDEYLSDGITEEIISQLAQVSGLKVISRTSVVALKGTPLTMPQIADTLGVRHILEGSVRRAGDRVRITAQLIEAASDAHLWAESYTRRVVDLFEVQEEIAKKVSDALVTTVAGLRPTGPRSRTENAAAYDAFLVGNYWVHGRTVEGLERAIEAYERAITIDPEYAPAYAGLAQALDLRVFYSGGSADAYRAEGRALAAADRAIELDPDLAQGYYTRAYIGTHLLRPAESVAADFERALELQPNSADLHGWYAHLLLREGKIEESMAENRVGVELDPLAPGRRTGFAFDALVARRYEVALEQARKATALEPDLLVPKVYEALALLLLGRPEECLGVDLGPRAAIHALCLQALGRTEEASAAIGALVADLEAGGTGAALEGRGAVLSDLGVYYARLGDRDASLDWIERALKVSPRTFDWRWERLELLDPVRENPEFGTRLDQLWEEVWARIREHHDAERVDLESATGP